MHVEPADALLLFSVPHDAGLDAQARALAGYLPISEAVRRDAE